MRFRLLAFSLSVLLGFHCGVSGQTDAESRQQESRPNLLFLVVDDLNMALGCYGDSLAHTPNLDRLASKSMVFDQAYAQFAMCNPSRSSFMTGRYPDETTVIDNSGLLRERLPDMRTFPQVLREEGYNSVRIGKIFHYSVPKHIGGPGLDHFDSWDAANNPEGLDKALQDATRKRLFGASGTGVSWMEVEWPDDRLTDGLVIQDAISALHSLDPDSTGKPFLLAVGLFRPHTPWMVNKQYFELHKETVFPWPELDSAAWESKPLPAYGRQFEGCAMEDNEYQDLKRAYYAAVSSMDAHVGRLLDSLEQMNLASNTVIVFVSDHGFHLGEQGLWGKPTLYDESLQVPLMIYDPRGTVGAGRSEALIELIDLFPTMIELTGSDAPESSGRSLLPLFGDSLYWHRPWAFSQVIAQPFKGNQVLGKNIRSYGYSLRDHQYRYIRWGGDDGEELYSLKEDPGMQRNLVSDTAYAATLNQYRVELRFFLESQPGLFAANLDLEYGEPMEEMLRNYGAIIRKEKEVPRGILAPVINQSGQNH